MRPHEFRELVNELRDTAVKYHDHQSLRERVVHVLWAHEVFPDAQPVPSVPDGFAWPECPKRRQSHVLFDDGYEEGWAACVATIKAALAAPEAKP